MSLNIYVLVQRRRADSNRSAVDMEIGEDYGRGDLVGSQRSRIEKIESTVCANINLAVRCMQSGIEIENKFNLSKIVYIMI